MLKRMKEEGESGSGRKGDDEKVPFYKLFSFSDDYHVISDILDFRIHRYWDGDCCISTQVFLFSLWLLSVCSCMVYDAVIYSSVTEVSSWMITGERQATRIRALYLKTILRQDIAFFDTETTTGEVIGRMSGDTILIQDAMGEKVQASLLCSFVCLLYFW